MARLSGTKGLDGRTLRQLFSRRSGEAPRVSPKEPRRSEGLPAIRIASPARAAESPAVVGRSGGGLRPRNHRRHIETMQPGAVGVRYDIPLSVHLRRNTWARTLSRESHSLHVEKNRKNIICYRLRASDMSPEEPPKPYDRVSTIARPGERTRYHTPLCAHRW